MKPISNQRIKTIVKQLASINDKIVELDKAIEYPYKAGHMVCINRSTDTWDTTKKHDNMVNTQIKKESKLWDELEAGLAGFGVAKQQVIDILVHCGLCQEVAVDSVEEWGL